MMRDVGVAAGNRKHLGTEAFSSHTLSFRHCWIFFKQRWESLSIKNQLNRIKKWLPDTSVHIDIHGSSLIVRQALWEQRNRFCSFGKGPVTTEAAPFGHPKRPKRTKWEHPS
jgi:hypothetical protein